MLNLVRFKAYLEHEAEVRIGITKIRPVFCTIPDHLIPLLVDHVVDGRLTERQGDTERREAHADVHGPKVARREGAEEDGADPARQ